MRIVKTNLDNTAINKDIMNSVIGQMSDGIWENSSRMHGYWVWADINDQVEIEIGKSRSVYSYYSCHNPYSKMTDEKVKQFFANKIKQIVRQELEDNYKEDVMNRFARWYGIPEKWYYCYPIEATEIVEECTNAYKTYLKEHPFKFTGLFKNGNNTPLVYLSYDENVTVDDAYKAYNALCL